MWADAQSGLADIVFLWCTLWHWQISRTIMRMTAEIVGKRRRWSGWQQRKERKGDEYEGETGKMKYCIAMRNPVSSHNPLQQVQEKVSFVSAYTISSLLRYVFLHWKIWSMKAKVQNNYIKKQCSKKVKEHFVKHIRSQWGTKSCWISVLIRSGQCVMSERMPHYLMAMKIIILQRA